MPTVRELYIYPVKSLAGIRVEDAELTDRGFQYDRRWMLIDENNVFLSQREHSQMALLQTAITENGIQVFAKNDKTISTLIPFEPEMIETTTVKIWDEFCHAIGVSDKTDQWFSEILGIKCRLVYMADKVIRKVDKRYALSENDIASFADAYPLLIISQESLQDLNSRMTQPLSMNRFRPNIVLDGVEPYEEDVMEEFAINGINFFGVKLCARCAITTINQDTAVKNKEPLRTLAIYRMRNNNVYFGQNVVYRGMGTIKTGDTIQIIRRKEMPVFEQEKLS